MSKKIVTLGQVGVNSGQLMICDPCYLDDFKRESETGKLPSLHKIYKHHEDGSLWQYTYGDKPERADVNAFPGSYANVIPQYGMTPNQLIEKGILVVSKEDDPLESIPSDEFSYRGACKATLGNENRGGEFNLAVATSTGYGDGSYDVKAEIVDGRVKKVWIEFF